MAEIARPALAVGGDKVVLGAGTTVEVFQGAPAALHKVAHFDVESVVDRLEVSPDGRSILVWGGRARQLWRWAEGEGHRLIATYKARDPFGCGFVTIGTEVLTVLGQGGVLRGLDASGNERFAANVAAPYNFLVHGFARLSPDRLALFGHEAGDYHDSVVTVLVDEIIRNRNAVQEAFRLRRPVYDRAIRIAIGPCIPGAAVVYRDPEDEEVPEDDEDLEELGDVSNFTGVYIRDLNSGSLVERIPYTGTARGVLSTATSQLVALEVHGGIDVIARGSGEIREIRSTAATLDVPGTRAAWLHENGRVEIVPIATLL